MSPSGASNYFALKHVTMAGSVKCRRGETEASDWQVTATNGLQDMDELHRIKVRGLWLLKMLSPADAFS